ncbi:Pentatricopeptide repeat-containing protein [Cynara cardunculus var. scolymus]|uniref:Pentatricopeptide repeat-containing protein n=1 Tax=Cynara cardunculus var. scolymus TaxID=59895 RepID=A0A103Y5J8_CYNCS|nr:Pentatricopeptide repeat-containing protein [Cynara cardunculus var. scolymus]
MKPHLPNPFKPSKFNIISTVVSKVATFLNYSLTVKQVKQLHALILINGVNYLEPMVITQIVSTPSNHSESIIHYLRSLLHQSKHPNIISRTFAIQFFFQHGKFQEVLAEYVHMQRLEILPTISAVAFALKACANLGNRIGGITIHSQIHGYGLCGDVHVGTALVGFYSKLNDMETAKKVFIEMSERNAASCLIDGYLESGNLSMAERVFSEMGNKDIASWNSMVSWYTKTGDMAKAIASFGPMPNKNLASWSAMIGGYVDSGNMEIARNFYDVMPEQNVVSCIKMIDGYSRKGAVESARRIFDEMGEKNRLLYNAMITCYAQNGWLKDALQLFDDMLQPNVSIQPDNVTLATVISICSQLGDLRFGSWINDTLMNQMGIVMDDRLRVLLIDLYAKFGRVDKAYGLFHGLQRKEASVYTTMILACSRNGWKHESIELFAEMLEAKICPNLVTFSGLLTALNHAGMVQESYHYFYTANPLSLNHKNWFQESYLCASPLSLQRPSNHTGWVQEHVDSTNPLTPFRLSNHFGSPEETYHGASPLTPPRPLNHHLDWVQQTYHGVNYTSPLAPSNHEDRPI